MPSHVYLLTGACSAAQVIRFFGHSDGFGTTLPILNPIQPTVGVFNEMPLTRYDFVLNACAQVCNRPPLKKDSDKTDTKRQP